MIAIKPFLRGIQADIYVPAKGGIERFILELENVKKRHLMRLFQQFTDYGSMRNTEHFRYEGKGIYAFKAGNVRILCVFLTHPGRHIQLLLHGYYKQSQKMPVKEFQKALQLSKRINEEGYELED